MDYKKRKKNKNFFHVGDVINNIVSKYRYGTEAQMLKLWEIWENAVGKIIAENTKPAAFKGNLLIVHVNNSAVLQQLRFLKEDMITKLNNALKEDIVKNIRFRIGPT
mmetsp:Transcript_3101/g.1817  ORF Transcript_3101/g.1817 Transcript_3101/m.1817 type:complete len:107 (+) Transcript_3101:5609-5929(+)